MVLGGVRFPSASLTSKLTHMDMNGTSLYQLAADYLNAEYKSLYNAYGDLCVIFKLPCGMCEVYTDTEVMDMARKQEVFLSIYPKG
jgi:hypothetical protein